MEEEQSFIPGDVVEILTGPFAKLTGKVRDVNDDKRMLVIVVEIFGRDTPKAGLRTLPEKVKMSERKPPLWTCPKCGHQFVTRNMWHSCGDYPLDYHFAGKDPALRKLFDKYVEFVERCGPITVYAQKSRITFQTRGRFTNVVVRKRWMECSLWLKRRVESPLFHRIDSFGPRDRVHYFRLSDESQLNDQLAAFVREAYAVGCQEDFD